MNESLDISNYLNLVLEDWRSSREDFPKNTPFNARLHWPIPFFGNPGTAKVATIGVNPSSGEFSSDRGWEEVRSSREWKLRLKNYFTHETPSRSWFDPWRMGLALLDCSYEEGSAVHIDVSYRTTTAMLRNEKTDREEFGRMIDRDVEWMFRLLPLCRNLRGLLFYGPIISSGGRVDSIASYFKSVAPRYNFSITGDGETCRFPPQIQKNNLFLHEVESKGDRSVQQKVVMDLRRNGRYLRQGFSSVG